MSGPEILAESDYTTINHACFGDSALAEVIQRLRPNWSVCPVCRVDDFAHSSTCTIYKAWMDNVSD